MSALPDRIPEVRARLDLATLFPQHEEFLRARAVPPSVAHRRGYQSIDSGEQLARAGFPPGQSQRLPRPGLLIPRYALDGRPSPWSKYRPDAPAYRRDGTPAKYVSPAGSWNFVDALPDTIVCLLGTTDDVWVSCEGFVKGDAMTGQGALVVAVDGVWGWRSSGKPLLGWSTILRRPRWLHLVADSDFGWSVDVPVAVCRLAVYLQSLGARVRVLHPSSEAGVKVGVDDHLAQGRTLEGLVEVRPEAVAFVARYRARSGRRVYSSSLTREGVT